MSANDRSRNSKPAARQHLLWLDDGHLGHQHQCWALISALQKRAEFVVHRYRIPSHAQWRYRLGGRWLLDTELNGLLSAHADTLMLSAGRRAAAVSLACAVLSDRVFRVQVLDPRRWRERFDLLVVPEHDQLQADNSVIMRGSLHDLRPQSLPVWRRASANLQTLRAPRYGLLLAGNAQQNEALFKCLATALVHGGSALVSASPRFGSCTQLLQRSGLAHHPDVRVFGPGGTVQINTDRASSLQMVLAWADVFLVAADGINQLNELLAVRNNRPIWVADQAIAKRHLRFLQPLLEQQLLQLLADFSLQPQQRTDCIAADTDKVVDAVMQRLTQRA